MIVDVPRRLDDPPQLEPSLNEEMPNRRSPNRNSFSDPLASPSPSDDNVPPPSYNETIASDQAASIEETTLPAVVWHPAAGNDTGAQNVREEEEPRTQRSPIRRINAIPTRSRVISIIDGVSQYECPLCLEDSDELSNITCGHVFCTTYVIRSSFTHYLY